MENMLKKESEMKALVNPQMCIGCNLCAQGCPEVFLMEGDKAVVHTALVPRTSEKSCRQAMRECPVSAIDLE